VKLFLSQAALLLCNIRCDAPFIVLIVVQQEFEETFLTAKMQLSKNSYSQHPEKKVENSNI